MQFYTFLLPQNDTKKISFITYEKHFEEDLADELHNRFRAQIINTERIILRTPVETAITFEKERILRRFNRLIERFENTPIYLLYSENFKHKLSENINEKA